ncbi:MAG: allantoicase [Xanthomonadaceae bacterium]|nr:allantoicase [Xanthomonadaceae bacterium]MDP2186263.1 allantoicase [Xanthomonadales bacterium]MDZ4117644.1 allantoicase [Xanthomonadaceae bacterium]MDZ4376543.1 allantoicase [Xanthomonadaceae bacterium]
MALPAIDPDAPEFTRRHVNLADARLGAQALACSDDFFAAMQRMLNPEPAVFIPGKYDSNGKWMDGWESRRKRVSGHDWCIVRLARPGRIHGIDLDTSHFTGNYPPAASVEGCCVADDDPDADTVWFELVAATDLGGDAHHYHAITQIRFCTHVRVNLLPDGGLARLRVYGTPQFDHTATDAAGLVDLASALQGGTIVATNNQHFGLASNLLLPGRGSHMGDGWETRRRREPGNDWCLIALAHPGIIEAIEVDTGHFKGNYPDRCSIQGAAVPASTPESLITQSMFWPTLLPEHALQADHQHFFGSEIVQHQPITHVRFNIFPDGGVSRLRLRGWPA